MSCDIHTHTPAQKSYTDFMLYPFLLNKCSTISLGHGHGYECHSLLNASEIKARGSLETCSYSFVSSENLKCRLLK